MTKKWCKVSRLLGALLASSIILSSCGGAGSSSDGPSSSDGGAASSDSASSGGTGGSWAGNANLNEPGVFPICKEPVTLTIGAPQNANIIDYETNAQTKWLEEKGNFDLSFVLYPSSEMATQITLSVTAGGGDLPDVIIGGLNDARAAEYGQAGAIIALNDYYENSSYFLKEAVERTGVDFVPMITAADGNIYGVPQYNQSLGNSVGDKFWMYMPWLEAVGLDVPTTPDELYTVLKAFKTQDPNGNGKDDEIPLVSSDGGSSLIHFLICPFVYVNAFNWFGEVVDGKVTVAYNTEGFREAMTYLNKLTSEKLLDPLTFTQNAEAFKAMVNSETTIVGASVRGAMTDINTSDPRRTEYESIPVLYNNEKTIQFCPQAPASANIVAAVSKNCKNPEAAFRMLDLMVSEDCSIMARWGQENVDWRRAAEGDKGMYEDAGYGPFLLESNPIWGTPQNQHWMQTGPFIRQYAIAAGMVWDGNTANTEYMIAKGIGGYLNKAPSEYITKLVYTADEEARRNELQTGVEDYVNSSVAAFATGSMSVENDWDSYLAQLNTLGLEELLSIYQTAYDRMK